MDECQARIEAMKLAMQMHGLYEKQDERDAYNKAGGLSGAADRITHWILTGEWPNLFAARKKE